MYNITIEISYFVDSFSSIYFFSFLVSTLYNNKKKSIAINNQTTAERILIVNFYIILITALTLAILIWKRDRIG